MTIMLPFHTYSSFFFFNDTAPTEIYTLSLHDALPIYGHRGARLPARALGARGRAALPEVRPEGRRTSGDRKSTRLNSSHVSISYAVFCLKKKKKESKSVLEHTKLAEPRRTQGHYAITL